MDMSGQLLTLSPRVRPRTGLNEVTKTEISFCIRGSSPGSPIIQPLSESLHRLSSAGSRKMGWLMNNELKGCKRKRSWLRVRCEYYRGRTEESHEKPQSEQTFSRRDINPNPLKYDSKVLQCKMFNFSVQTRIPDNEVVLVREMTI
jgi:hypothetical protein